MRKNPIPVEGDELRRLIEEHWDELGSETQILWMRFIELLPTARGDEVAWRRLRNDRLDLAACVEMLERRAAMRGR